MVMVTMMMMRRRLWMTAHCSSTNRAWRLLVFSFLLVLTTILFVIGPSSQTRCYCTTASAWILVPTTSTRTKTTNGYTRLPPWLTTRTHRKQKDHSTCPLFAGGRKNRRPSSVREDNSDKRQDLDRWYQAVEPDASPDDVFWEEMERQRLLAKIGQGGGGGDGSISSSSPTMDILGTSSSSTSSNYASMSSGSSVMSGSFGGGGPAAATAAAGYTSFPSSFQQQQQQQQQSLDKTNSLLAMASMSYTGIGGTGGQQQQQSALNSAEATLSQYASYAVADNWLDDDLVWMMKGNDEMYQHGDDDDDDLKSLDEQLEEWESHEDHDDNSDDDEDDDDTAWMQSDEPWDSWDEKRGKTMTAAASTDGDENASNNPVMLSTNNRASAYLLHVDDDGNDTEEDADAAAAASEEEYQRRLARLKVSSRRLEHARNNSKAAAFFARQPDAESGYDRLWVSAIDNVCFKSLVGLARNYGIEFADNFGDWQDGCLGDSLATIEDIASFKARQVYNVTGLPCIASRTSFEVEPIPVPQGAVGKQQQQPLLGRPATANIINPRVASGYRFNDIGMHVDYVCDALRPLSEPNRVTSFKSCLCYYDGQMEVFDYGVCDVDLYFANSLRTFIPMSQAIQEMIKTLELTFGLEYQSWVEGRTVKVATGTTAVAEKSLPSAVITHSTSTTSLLGPASLKLRDRVLKDGKVLPNNIIDVSAFMDSLVDVNLMDECAKELYQRFAETRPSKILTVATTGLVIALPMAKYLQIPVVYARKERTVTMADTYKAGYSSKTVGKSRELIVSKSHLSENDRILIVDDFLSSGASQEALLRIVSSCPGATAVGIGVLLEKVFDSGRQSLSGFNVPIHSLCKIASVDNGIIQLEEEEGFDRMKRSKQAQK